MHGHLLAYIIVINTVMAVWALPLCPAIFDLKCSRGTSIFNFTRKSSAINKPRSGSTRTRIRPVNHLMVTLLTRKDLESHPTDQETSIAPLKEQQNNNRQ